MFRTMLEFVPTEARHCARVGAAVTRIRGDCLEWKIRGWAGTPHLQLMRCLTASYGCLPGAASIAETTTLGTVALTVPASGTTCRASVGGRVRPRRPATAPNPSDTALARSLVELVYVFRGSPVNLRSSYSVFRGSPVNSSGGSPLNLQRSSALVCITIKCILNVSRLPFLSQASSVG